MNANGNLMKRRVLNDQPWDAALKSGRAAAEPNLRINMSAAVCVFILTLSTLNGVVSGVLRSPTNVQVTSRDLNLILSWDPPAEAPSGLIYTTEFKNSIGIHKPGCVNITTFQCELSNFGISLYGTYSGKVRALLGEETSAWVESKNITLDTETLISPPSVSLLSIGQTLEISIKEPEFYISSLRNVYSKVSYNITYWKDDQEMMQEKTLSNIVQDRVILDELDPLTKYCVQVRIITLRNKNPSEPSGVLCERTGDTDNSPMVAAVIVCVVIAVAVVMTVLAVVKWKSISHFLWPKVSLPRHFEKSLLDTPESSVCLITQPTEEIAPVSVVTVEEGSPERTKESSYNKQLNGTVGDSCLPGD
ncbi:interleukin-10 receptor subunit beta-like [Xiphophorus maculatus]|uniref:Interleukin-10 receptor subunit beta-like n=1 Tax=Xiphophorus maculatus TaxID=8083 RepID=A0A3B5Q7Q3_XIPMA|nr:interleukin-10 receptor subunit beta-like [Xiphophorus maculatus]